MYIAWGRVQNLRALHAAHLHMTHPLHAAITWSVEVQVTGLLFVCVTCTGKAVVDTVMDWLEVEELQLDNLLGGWRGCLCQCCVHQVPITDHHPVLVEGHGEGITCVSDGAADGEGNSSVEVVASTASKSSVVWLHTSRWNQTRCQSESCQRIIRRQKYAQSTKEGSTSENYRNLKITWKNYSRTVHVALIKDVDDSFADRHPLHCIVNASRKHVDVKIIYTIIL